ncbi:MAG TPA: peptide chain release factor 1 [Candidatus Megaira endosymbiont of Hartmannula sinica]|nr:peptide chain release factor 1 [Candidatus Megaera endosymbiont of Hartmannula sinica]
MSFEANLAKILDKYNNIAEKLNSTLSTQDLVAYSKEYSKLEPVILLINNFNEIKQQIKDTEELLLDPEDEETREVFQEELIDLQKQIPILIEKIKISLIPKDIADEKNAIIEIRGGAGGEEAALFASDLFQMYQRYAEQKGWKIEILQISENGIGGYKEASAIIKGENVFQRMKFESGVHRVQRVPKTESSGRVHTSAATVAVLPEAEDIDVKIEEKDLRIDTYRSSGAGGQHVNTTDSAVRITHIPTKIVVCQQDEKSQHKNKAKAMKILRAKLFEQKRKEEDDKMSAERKSQVGSGDRSERIRTYNFSESRVTDHRISLTLYKLEDILNQGNLDFLIEPLIAEDQASKLASSDLGE